jgi:hypothetical protein
MRANAIAREIQNTPNKSQAVESLTQVSSDCLLTARLRLEDRFRQEFAERGRCDGRAEQHGGLAPPLPADRRKQ